MTSFRGYPACTCLAEWLPVLEAEAKRRGFIKESLDVYQLIGGAAASGGTHSSGGAFDVGQGQPGFIRLCRDMGADATWRRKYNWDNRGGMAHTHGVLRGCQHNGPARYQITSQSYGVDHGHNGLANGARDDGPRPLSGRTWKEGIAWAKEQQTPTTTLRIGQFNFPGADKIGNSKGRIASMLRLIDDQKLHVIGWNELVGIKSAGVASDFAHDVDAALGSKWRLVKPTLRLNENYISYRGDVLEVVKQYDDSILEARTGGRHLTRVVFRYVKTGFTFAVGQTHLVNDGGAQGEKDRQTQAADALASMKAVSAKHGNCPFIIQGDMNTHADLVALTKAGMKRTRKYADESTSRNDATYTNINKAVPSTNTDWIIDHQYVSPAFYVVAYNVIRDLVSGQYRKPRASDHDLVVTEIRTK